MRIVFLAGANSIHSYKWVKFIAEVGHEVIWISFEKNEFENIKGVNFILAPKPKNVLGILRCIGFVRNFKNKYGHSLIHVHSIGAYGLLGIMFFYFGFKNMVITPWGSDVIFGREQKYKAFVIKILLRNARLITCDAIFIKEMMMKIVDVSSKVSVINFGVDTKMFNALSATKYSQYYFKQISRFSIISTRNFHKVYDIRTLILAIPEIIETIPNLHVTIVGAGPEKANLLGLVEELKIAHLVEFVGQVDNRMLPKLLNKADIYVSTSLSDAGLAASTAEAMACGLPALITNTAENSEWVQHGHNGFLFNKCDYQALAALIIEIYTQRYDLALISKNAREIILSKNDYQTEMKKMNAEYLMLDDNKI